MRRAPVFLLLLALATVLCLPAFPAPERPRGVLGIPDLIPSQTPGVEPTPLPRIPGTGDRSTPSPRGTIRDQAPVPVRRPSPFLVSPYVQPGPVQTSGNLVLMWETPDRTAHWQVQVRGSLDEGWDTAVTATGKRVALPGVEPWRSWTAPLAPLAPGTTAWYRVVRNGEVVFQSFARTPHAVQQASRIAVFGDAAEGTPEQKAIAWQVWKQAPDGLFITGDVVYPNGRLSDYRRHFFPIYNAEEASATTGAPIMRTIPTWTVVGNHDTGTTSRATVRDLVRFPDGLAWFLVWSHPLNGPHVQPVQGEAPPLIASALAREAFTRAASPAFPRMGNYSFDFGDTHWTVLDGNDYMDWTRPALRAWVRNDLLAARQAAWRIVALHQAPFHSSSHHAHEQRMRLLADIFQEGRVSLVLGGHVHAYERTRPLRFRAHRLACDAKGRVDGEITLDRRYDGRSQTRPDGIIYVVTGAGGAELDSCDLDVKPATWKPYTAHVVTRRHSFTLLDASDRGLVLRQLAADGTELDRFVITR